MKILLVLLVLFLVLYYYNSTQREDFREITKEEICHQDNKLLVVEPPNIPVAPEKFYPVTQNKEGLEFRTTLNHNYPFRIPVLKYDGIFSRHCDMKGVNMEECGWSL